MSNMRLTIQHNNILYEPPIKDGVKLEWERTGVPGKLTFTVLKTSGLNFTEGDPVCFYYNDKKVFMGYVFKKKRDREQHIEVTCYDQLRYLKNKYTYVFEKKTASQIIKALCNDFKLSTGTIDNTQYVIPAIAEENKSAFDIILSALEDTLLNTGNMFVLYDDFGKLKVKNCTNMVSTTLIMKDTAENFDYTSSIDDETYNQVVLYYKNDKEIQQIYTASSPSTIKQWGTLRYFEEVKSPTIGQNKANSLLKLYNRKTRELKVNGAFGDATVRGGTLIPVQLDVGDKVINNFMLVESVTHTFENDRHTMDLTLEGAWEDGQTSDTVSKTIGELPMTKENSSTVNNTTNTDNTTTTKDNSVSDTEDKYVTLAVYCVGGARDSEGISGNVFAEYFDKDSNLVRKNLDTFKLEDGFKLDCSTTQIRKGCMVKVDIIPKAPHNVEIISVTSNLEDYHSYLSSKPRTRTFGTHALNEDADIKFKWVKGSTLR